MLLLLQNTSIVHDTLYLHDTIFKVIDASKLIGQSKNISEDYLQHVEHFYENSWSNLMWFVGAISAIGVLILGIIVPYLQARRLRIDEERMEGRFNEQISNSKKEVADLRVEMKAQFDQIIEKAKGELKENFETSIENSKEDLRKSFVNDIEGETKKLNDKLNQKIHNVKGFSAYLLGSESSRDKKFKEATFQYLISVLEFIRSEDFDNANLMVENAVNNLLMAGLTKRSEIFDGNYALTFEDYFEEVILLSKSDKNIYQKISKLKKEFEKIPE